MKSFAVKGNIADIPAKKFFCGTLNIENGRIASVQKNAGDVDESLPYIVPGFIDSHVHIES